MMAIAATKSFISLQFFDSIDAIKVVHVIRSHMRGDLEHHIIKVDWDGANDMMFAVEVKDL
jgi:hypothetical protein